jgi:predicted phage terminase large subunit-like protein
LFIVDSFHFEQTPPDPNNPRLWARQVRYWDKAATYDDGAWTVGVRMGKDLDQNFWVLHVDRFRVEPRAREIRMRHVAETDGRHVIVGVEQEPGSAGKESALGTIRGMAGFRVVLDRPTGDKEKRADPFATQVNGENVYIAPEAIIPMLPEKWHRNYIEEMRYFPFSKYKDQADASSGAFNQLVGAGRRVGFGFGLKKRR